MPPAPAAPAVALAWPPWATPPAWTAARATPSTCWAATSSSARWTCPRCPACWVLSWCATTTAPTANATCSVAAGA
ncbi:hypothetical protein DY262_21415 [Hydrogenophaga borbori]|uniref:Uncharacterized protein n=1 Tax=Hydrogenophaga borbori TaxID=2294117 RepID=A0A372EDP6_9BURK|nr:hypothetical protein DY262_21415 [Hydrogenophaga borbori]